MWFEVLIGIGLLLNLGMGFMVLLGMMEMISSFHNFFAELESRVRCNTNIKNEKQYGCIQCFDAGETCEKCSERFHVNN